MLSARIWCWGRTTSYHYPKASMNKQNKDKKIKINVSLTFFDSMLKRMCAQPNSPCQSQSSVPVPLNWKSPIRERLPTKWFYYYLFMFFRWVKYELLFIGDRWDDGRDGLAHAEHLSGNRVDCLLLVVNRTRTACNQFDWMDHVQPSCGGWLFVWLACHVWR